MNAVTVKNLARRRDGFRCVDCGRTEEEHRSLTGKRLDVHRLIPGSEYSLETCVTLCQKCHVARHRNQRPKTVRKRIEFVASRRFIGLIDAGRAKGGLSRAAYIRMACNRLMASDKKQSDA